MADKKISALTGASTPLAGTEVLPIVQGGATVKVAVSDLTAGRNVSVAALSATGVATFSAGTVSLPAITQISDLNTGIYFPTADTLGFTTGGTERVRVDSAGAVGIGGTPSAATSVDFLKNITGGTTSIAVRNGGTIQSDVTGLAIGYQSTPSTVASLAVTQIDFYRAQQGTIGASSTVTNQIGFNAHSSITGATNNYGVLSNIASGTNRYNFFAQGTATNYFAGVVQTNATTAIPAGGTTGAGVTVSSTNNFGVFFGSGAPTLSAAKGSLYLRSDGSTVNDRMYVNTNGSTTWTSVVTSA